MAEIKLVISEVDGVLTDGSITFDELGNVPFKKFFLDDFAAINKIKSKAPVVFISADNCISYHLMRRKNIPFYWDSKNRLSKIPEILMNYQVTKEEVLFIGAKLSDRECILAFPNSVCPSNANVGIKQYCTVLDTSCGQGVLAEVYFRYFS